MQGGAALLMNVNNGDSQYLWYLYLILILINVKKLKTKNSLIKLQKEYMNLVRFLKLLLLH